MSMQNIFLTTQHNFDKSPLDHDIFLAINTDSDFPIIELDKNISSVKLVAQIIWKTENDKNHFISHYESKHSNNINMIFTGPQIQISLFINSINNNSLKIKLSSLKNQYNLGFTSQVYDEETYRWLATTHQFDYLDFLRKIKDAATSINIFKNIKYNNQFIKYNLHRLIIDNSATNYAYTKGYNIILSSIQSPVYNMERTEELSIPSSNKSIKIRFTNNLKIDNPIHAIIGKNGSGKSYHIKKFLSLYFKNIEYQSHISNAIFSRIILISNTVDDKEYTPSKICKNKNKRSNYHFISNTSLRHYNNIYSYGNKITINGCVENIILRELTRSGVFDKALIADEIIHVLNLNIDILFCSSTEFHLAHSISEALSFFRHQIGTHKSNSLNLADINLAISFRSGNEKTTLSSGQSTFLIKTLSILMTIETNSLVIIEEPENFLHPSLLTNLMKVLKKILIQTNSCSIISTHSPLVLRELPKEQVTIFSRHNNITSNRSPSIETFGADATELYQESFSDLESSAAYRESINEIAKSENSVDILLKKYSHLPSSLLNKIINEWRRK
ncbi:AAA family ATPase [Citrobacter youngae]|uniref:AAA family ATPase n=1 Tax=Citrobacter youngae TaxID=133448 RepID=UPI002FCD806F